MSIGLEKANPTKSLLPKGQRISYAQNQELNYKNYV